MAGLSLLTMFSITQFYFIILTPQHLQFLSNAKYLLFLVLSYKFSVFWAIDVHMPSYAWYKWWLLKRLKAGRFLFLKHFKYYIMIDESGHGKVHTWVFDEVSQCNLDIIIPFLKNINSAGYKYIESQAILLHL